MSYGGRGAASRRGCGWQAAMSAAARQANVTSVGD